MRQFCSDCTKDKDIALFTRDKKVGTKCNECAVKAAARQAKYRAKKKREFREWQKAEKIREELEAMKHNWLTRNMVG